MYVHHTAMDLQNPHVHEACYTPSSPCNFFIAAIARSPQAKSGEDDIPDQDIITRRQQFQMKKTRAEDKKEKKAQKKAEKQQKKAEKLAKQAAKQAEKTSAKKGRNASEKNKARQSKGSRSKQQQDEDVKGEDATSSWETPGVHSRKMKRMKMMAKGAKKTLNAEDPTCSKKKVCQKKPKASQQDIDIHDTSPVEGAEVSEQPLCAAEDGKRKRKTAAKSKAAPEALPKAKAKAQPKGKAKAKAKTAAKKKAEAAEKPKRTRNMRKVNNVPADPAIKEIIAKTLQECTASHCTHPSYEKVKHRSVDLEPYKARKACGVKLERRFFKNHKAQGKGKAHVTYFSGRTTCHYTNMVLGNLWVSRLHARLCIYRFLIIRYVLSKQVDGFKWMHMTQVMHAKQRYYIYI